MLSSGAQQSVGSWVPGVFLVPLEELLLLRVMTDPTSSLVKRVSTSPWQSDQVRNFSTMYASSPARDRLFLQHVGAGCWEHSCSWEGLLTDAGLLLQLAGRIMVTRIPFPFSHY